MPEDIVVARVADGFAAAALDPTLWLGALQSLADLTRSSRAQLVGIGGPDLVQFNWMTGAHVQMFDDFVAVGGYSPTVNYRVAASHHARLMQIVHEADYNAIKPALQGDIYQDFAHHYDISLGCQASLHIGVDRLIGLAVLRGEAEGATTEQDRARFAAIVPHVAAAVRMQHALEEQGALLIAGGFESMAAAAFVIDSRGRVAAMTPAAERLVAQGRLRLADGRLATPDPQASARLAALLAAHIDRPMTADPIGSVALRGRPDDPLLIAEVSRLPRRDWSFGFLPSALVVVRGAGRRHARDAQLLRDAYGLSMAEADIVLRIVAGEEREAIALARGVSVQTVRTQFKTIFAKLGVKREVELVVRLSALLRDGV